MCHIRKQIRPVVCIGNRSVCLINARMPCKYAIAMSSTQDCFSTGTRHANASPYILWSLIAQHLVGIEGKILKEVVVWILDRLKNPTQEPISGHCSFDCCSERGLICGGSSSSFSRHKAQGEPPLTCRLSSNSITQNQQPVSVGQSLAELGGYSLLVPSKMRNDTVRTDITLVEERDDVFLQFGICDQISKPVSSEQCSPKLWPRYSSGNAQSGDSPQPPFSSRSQNNPPKGQMCLSPGVFGLFFGTHNTSPHPPLEQTSSPPFFIAFNALSHWAVVVWELYVRWFNFFYPKPSRTNSNLLSLPNSALRHWKELIVLK